MSEDWARLGLTLARVAGALALLTGAYLVLQPFLVPMIWAAIVAYVSWPLFRRVRDWSRFPRLTAGAFTLAFAVGLALPVAWLLVALAEQGTQLIRLAQDWLQAGAPLPAWVTESTWLGPYAESARGYALPDAEALTSYVTRFGRTLSERLVAVAGSAARNVFALAVTLLVLFAFYLEGEQLIAYARRWVHAIFPTSSTRFLEDVGAVVRAVVFGLIGTAIVQGLLQALGLALFGVPSPVALGALTAVLSFVPAGPVLVWAGAAGWLFLAGKLGAAVGMALWGALLVSSVDNVLRPILIGRSGAMKIPFLLVFFGVLGGLAAFGLLGLFLGPVLLSVTFALVADFPGTAQRDPGATPGEG